MLLKTQLRLAGHVSRMQVHRLPKIVLYDELSSNTLKYLLKKSLSACHIDHRQWLVLAADREAWRHAVHQSVSSLENNRRAALQERRSRRKNRIVSAPNTPAAAVVCLSHIGLVSHQPACTRRGKRSQSSFLKSSQTKENRLGNIQLILHFNKYCSLSRAQEYPSMNIFMLDVSTGKRNIFPSLLFLLVVLVLIYLVGFTIVHACFLQG